VSLSFDWETAMGGIVHTRSGEAAGDQVGFLASGMRTGVGRLLKILEPGHLRATWFATGYNFLRGNTRGERFMGDPVFSWATTAYGFAPRWATTRWFADDPLGTVTTRPEWYFGDLIERLVAGGQAIESHTFSHLDLGLAASDEVRADLAAWNDVASRCGLAPARALSCPWGNSGGAPETTWRVLSEGQITAVTRGARTSGFCGNSLDLLVPQPHPVFKSVVLFPDLFVTAQTEAKAYGWIKRATQSGGAIDLWIHPSDLVEDNEAVWRRLAASLAGRTDVWVAPLSEIAERWLATRGVRATITSGGDCQRLVVEKAGSGAISDLALEFPTVVTRVELGGIVGRIEGHRLVLDLPARATIAGRVCLAR
jgi:peptidoglycan/xylan/chitin deacetylase (PgdA/CDA1 family)